MKEDDAMVYRNPYLTSGASGFALNAISRDMKKELKVNLLLLLLSSYCLQSIRVYISSVEGGRAADDVSHAALHGRNMWRK